MIKCTAMLATNLLLIIVLCIWPHKTGISKVWVTWYSGFLLCWCLAYKFFGSHLPHFNPLLDILFGKGNVDLVSPFREVDLSLVLRISNVYNYTSVGLNFEVDDSRSTLRNLIILWNDFPFWYNHISLLKYKIFKRGNIVVRVIFK